MTCTRITSIEFKEVVEYKTIGKPKYFFEYFKKSYSKIVCINKKISKIINGNSLNIMNFINKKKIKKAVHTAEKD